MTEEYRKPPSLEPENHPGRPCGLIQWKGTDVCVDIYCKCGKQMHFDGDFMYYVKCPHCNQVYECGGWIKLHPIDYEPEQCLQLLEKDDDG